MQKVLLIIFTLFNVSIYAQSNIDECIENLKVEKSNVVLSKESIMFYPRGFIYNLNEPDSIFYFGCMKSDCENVKLYFDDKIKRKKPINQKIIRGYQQYSDTIYLESIDKKIAQLEPVQNGINMIIRENMNYVVLYYWSCKMLNRKYKRNIRFLEKFATNNSHKGIQVIFVLTDQN